MRNQVFHFPDCSDGLEPALASKIAIRSILSNLKASGRKGRIVRQACVEESSGEAHGNLWVCYAAVEVINKYTNQCQVFACVAHVEGGTKQCPVVSVSILSEEDNPKFCACPPYVIEVLTATDSKSAKLWRSRAAQKMSKLYKYQTDVEISAVGDRSVTLTLTTAHETHVIRRTANLGHAEFANAYEEYVNSYRMSSISTVRT